METIEKQNLVTVAREYAIDSHRAINQMYDNQPYEVHLKMVNEFASQFQHLVEDEYLEIVHAGCWVHDMIEDVYSVSYNDIKKRLGTDVAEIAYALTNEKGKTRKERANEKYYKGIRDVPYADFVKICDRLANINYSKNSGSTMIDAYRRENEFFKTQLFNKRFESMFELIDQLLA